jgi:hypothetical protein
MIKHLAAYPLPHHVDSTCEAFLQALRWAFRQVLSGFLHAGASGSDRDVEGALHTEYL